VQVSTPRRTALVDPLALPDLARLRAALDRPDVEVVFHGGDYDVSVLTRDHGFRFDRVFDTMIAATLLGEERVGLADLVGGAFGVTLDKRFQKADWARRPLSPEHLEYLRRDTAYLLALRDLFHDRLAAADLVEEAGIEFRRLAARRGRRAEPDPEGWRRLKGAERLGAEGRAVLHALFAWREREAERRDAPPFHVLPPQALVAIAGRPPQSEEDLRLLHPGDRRRHGSAILAVSREGIEAAASGRAPAPPGRPAADPAEQARRKVLRRREEALRDWRRDEAARRKVPNVVVLPNPALEWIVETRPATVEALAAHPDVGRKRADRYGRAILDALARSD
jgi:ribonuclease D